MILGITGHRPGHLGGYGENPLRVKVRAAMQEQFVKLAPTLVLSGMALGVDQWACELALAHGIPYHAYVPFLGQDHRWTKDQQDHYYFLCSRAKEVKYISNAGYALWKMQKRNEKLVDACEHLLAVFDGSEGGTANCLSYAKKAGRHTTIINPKELT